MKEIAELIVTAAVYCSSITIGGIMLILANIEPKSSMKKLAWFMFVFMLVTNIVSMFKLIELYNSLK